MSNSQMKTTDAPRDDGAGSSARRAAMKVLARASLHQLKEGLAASDLSLEATDLRKPEVGLVMARGRISGTGCPFNVGEVTVTRAAVRLADGTVGHAYLMGRDPERARLAAIADAHWQNEASRAAIEAQVIEPVRQHLAARQRRRRGEVAATQVDFFTMVRGDG